MATLVPMVIAGYTYENRKHCNIQIYKFRARGFRDDFFKKFSHDKSMGAKTLGHDQLGPQGYSWQDLFTTRLQHTKNHL